MWYDARLISHPVVVKAITSGVLTMAGDFAAQAYLAGPDQPWSAPRLLLFGFLGTFFIGPVLHVWYGGIHASATIFLSTFRKSPRMRTAICVLNDQVLFAPIFLSAYLTAYTLCMARVSELQPKTRYLFGEILGVNYFFWVPVQWINFAYVLPRYNVLFSNVAAVVWNSYLSWKQNPPEP